VRIEQQIVKAWAKELNDKIVGQAIRELEQMDGMEMLSGDDSSLKNVWEEICVQVQFEESADWDAYIETMESVLESQVQLLSSDARLALWVTTDEGWNYVYDNHTDENGAANAPVFDGDIVNAIKDKLLAAASNYSTQNIDRFLMRLEGYDDSDEDEYEDFDRDDDEDTGDTECQHKPGQNLTEYDAAIAFARAWNRLEPAEFLATLSPDARYASQWVFEELVGAAAIGSYLHGKMQTVRTQTTVDPTSRVRVEVGRTGLGEAERPCALMLQGNGDEIVGIVIFEVRGNRVWRYDLCMPELFRTGRSGVFPK